MLPYIKMEVASSGACGAFWLTGSQQFHLMKNLRKRLVKTPKLFFLDKGLCSYLTEWSTRAALAAGAMRGGIFETCVFAELLRS